MTTSIAESSPATRGRILAGLYLLVVVGGIIGQAFISDRLVVATDATKTAANILANKSLYRLAFSIFMVEMVAQVVLSMMFYDLLKPVNRSAARSAAVIGVFGFESVLRGWLVIKSDFLPRFLGVLELIGGLAWLTFLWPPLGYQLFTPVALFALVGVFMTCGWLLVRGVDDAKWRARAALAATSIWR